ncbi:SLAP domain-containing protein [Companilactobacillus kedongensis]|uniref:SLAP domain-containing protein n=1 Tax=Companilactobacillus kedongensis TaxID=2486004 RepID=UPI000F7B0A42|nr:SLAP domain-containing protein [Companilactobacillus kedongensis]
MRIQYRTGRLSSVSLLSLASGLIILGTNVDVANADVSLDAATTGTDSNQVQTESVAAPTNSGNAGSGQNYSEGNGSDGSADTGASAVATDEGSYGTGSTGTITENQGSTIQPYSANSAQDTNANASTFSIPADTAADHQGKLSGDDGSDWYLDNNGTLYIGAGTVSDPTFDSTTKSDDLSTVDDVWNNYKYADDITNVTFEDGAVAGTSLAKYFDNMKNLTSADVRKLDVSNTTDFSEMFANIVSLQSLDISDWKLADGVNFTGFVSGNSALTSLNISGLTMTHPNLDRAFGFNSGLTNIDMTGFSATGITSAETVFYKDAKLTSLDLTGFDFSSAKTVGSMLGDMNSLMSLKVNNNTILEGTGLINPDGYKGWSDGTHIYSSDDLMGVYDNAGTPSAARTSTTWEAVGSTDVNYTINYHDALTDKIVGTVSGTGAEGSGVDLKPDYPGYSRVAKDNNGDPATSIQLPVTDLGQVASDRTYDFKIMPGRKINVTESDTSTINSQDIYLFDDDTADSAANVAAVKTNLAADRTLDLANTTVDFTLYGNHIQGKLSDKSLEGYTIGQLIQMFSTGNMEEDGTTPLDLGSDTTREQLIDYLVMISDTYSVPVSLDLVYKPLTTTGGNSSSTGDSNSTILKDQRVATTTTNVSLYDATGKMVTNRGLDINTAWKSDAEYNLNGVLYYRVSSDEYVKASDVYVYVDNIADIEVKADQKGDLVDYLGGELDRKLGASTDWKTDRIALIDGKRYYRVSTDEFVLFDEAFEY